MKEYLWENKQQGYLIPESYFFDDACLIGYDDVIDPMNLDYLVFEKYYTKTNWRVK